jgi:Glycosyl hydrolases related to GH101 family, GH129
MRRCFFLVALLPLMAHAEPITLRNAQWRIQIEPTTLAIDVTPADRPGVNVSRGSDSHAVNALVSDDTHAQWQWDEETYRLSAVLSGRDLIFTIKAQAASQLTFLRQPGEASGRGLIVPLAEGHYVPANDPVWRAFLLEEFNDFDSSEALSLPLWGMDHEAFSLHWLLLEPFGNRMQWQDGDDAPGINASHRFSSLDPKRPLVFMLHLGDSLLAGAKRYRQWLQEQGQFESMAAKIAATPDTEKLLGASHIYLWGGGLLGVKDVTDWEALRHTLSGQDKLANMLLKHFDKEARSAITGQLDSYRKNVLVRALNYALLAQARSTWQTGQPDATQLATRYGQLRDEVATVFAHALRGDPGQWGDGLSIATMKQLCAAGLTRLWVGLGEGWEPGLWHPEAVRAGVAAGYLVAPYDSYETALKPDGNPDWATAHLGDDAYNRCGIIREDGSARSGFLGQGHYTDTRCVTPGLKQRVAAVRRYAGFNSWFLDAYATGMVFESYRPGATLSFAQHARDNIAAMAWVVTQMSAPVGSEGGNATTAGGLAFAHGMQTPVIGWSDPDIGQSQKKNPSSRYFMGTYYPPEQPGVFFKTVPTKSLYQHIHFAPQTRLPLYQAVFHDSIITTHHWHTDNLKLGNVRRENELAQLLYNVPPLYHLSAGTLKQRLPLIRRMDTFFRPLHEHLATQALTDFRWLSEDRLLQETRFADGSFLRANFSSTERSVGNMQIAPYTVVATDSQGGVSDYRANEPVDSIAP